MRRFACLRSRTRLLGRPRGFIVRGFYGGRVEDTAEFGEINHDDTKSTTNGKGQIADGSSVLSFVVFVVPLW